MLKSCDLGVSAAQLRSLAPTSYSCPCSGVSVARCKPFPLGPTEVKVVDSVKKSESALHRGIKNTKKNLLRFVSAILMAKKDFRIKKQVHTHYPQMYTNMVK